MDADLQLGAEFLTRRRVTISAALWSLVKVTDVLECALRALRNRRVEVGTVLYLVQCDREPGTSPDLGGVASESLALPLGDPTHHAEVYAAVWGRVVPRLNGQETVNVSPGTGHAYGVDRPSHRVS